MFGYAESGEIIASPEHPARTLFGAFIEEIESEISAQPEDLN
jgi:hypothetical protein